MRIEKIIKRTDEILIEECDDGSIILFFDNNVFTLNLVSSILFKLIKDQIEKNDLFNEYLKNLKDIFDDVEENYHAIYDDFENELKNWYDNKLIIIEEK